MGIEGQAVGVAFGAEVEGAQKLAGLGVDAFELVAEGVSGPEGFAVCRKGQAGDGAGGLAAAALGARQGLVVGSSGRGVGGSGVGVEGENLAIREVAVGVVEAINDAVEPTADVQPFAISRPDEAAIGFGDGSAGDDLAVKVHGHDFMFTPASVQEWRRRRRIGHSAISVGKSPSGI